MDFLCPCGGDGVQESKLLSSWTDVASRGAFSSWKDWWALWEETSVSSSTSFPEYLGLRQVACEHFPSPQWQDNIPCSPFHPASCSCLPPYICFPLVFHHPTITWISTLLHQPLPWALGPVPAPCSSISCFCTRCSSWWLFLLSTLSGPDFCCIPDPLSPPAWSRSIALPTNTWCHYQRKGLEHPPWFSLVLPLAWSPPSPTQVCKSLLPMSASKLVYPPPIPAFITLPKWSDISSAEASRRCSQYPNHESWHNKWRQSAGGPGHLSHCATSRCQLHYSLKLPEKIT